MVLRIAIFPGILAGLTGTWAGCAAEAAPDPSLVARVKAAQARMHVRYEAAQRMQTAIGLSDLDRTRAEARRIVALDEPDILPEWRVYIDDVRAAARRVEKSKTTFAAAAASADLGRACAKCHVAGKTRITFPKQPRPPDDPRLANQMFAHQWGAARMWEGLVGPDDARWKAGATELAGARLSIAAESGSLGIADDISRVRLFARRALDPKNRIDRATQYKQILETCVHCHFKIREGGR